MSEQYRSLILVIFNEAQLKRYQQKYYASDEATLFGIAEEMKAEAHNLIEEFDFLDFAETILHQVDSSTLKSHIARSKHEPIKRF